MMADGAFFENGSWESVSKIELGFWLKCPMELINCRIVGHRIRFLMDGNQCVLHQFP